MLNRSLSRVPNIQPQFPFVLRQQPPLSAGNSLTSIPDGYFRTLPNLTAIDVSFNDGDSTGIQITTALAY